MELTPEQIDALGELINIGFGRAASALSILVGQRVLLETPDIELYPLETLHTALSNLSDGEVTSVHQVFTGKLVGDAMLLLDSDSATSLVDLLAGGAGQPHPIGENDRETLQEVGNILLNAFTGSFGNLLQVHISFTVPQLRSDSLRNMIRSLLIDQRGVEFALVVRVNFRLTQGDVNGYVIIVMGIQSLEALLDSMRAIGYID
jgi:chemotaxis protein CheC